MVNNISFKGVIPPVSFDLAKVNNLSLKDKNIKSWGFKNAILQNCQFEDVVIEGWIFDNATLENCTFKNVTFTNCSFQHADLTKNVLFQGIIFKGQTDFNYAKITSKHKKLFLNAGLNKQQLKKTKIETFFKKTVKKIKKAANKIKEKFKK